MRSRSGMEFTIINTSVVLGYPTKRRFTLRAFRIVQRTVKWDKCGAGQLGKSGKFGETLLRKRVTWTFQEVGFLFPENWGNWTFGKLGISETGHPIVRNLGEQGLRELGLRFSGNLGTLKLRKMYDPGNPAPHFPKTWGNGHDWSFGKW